MLETPDLRYFAALATQPSLAAAARALNVTPPAVSQRLAQLEARLGLRLVERNRGRLILTAEGEILGRLRPWSRPAFRVERGCGTGRWLTCPAA